MIRGSGEADSRGEQLGKPDGAVAPARHRAPLLVLGLALLSTLGVTWHLLRTAEAKDQERFANSVERTCREITSRFDNYLAMLTGAAGLFAASDSVSAADFHAYCERLNLVERFPGVQGLGWSMRVPEGQHDALVERMRDQGFTEFRIWGERDAAPGAETHSILYLEPRTDRNIAAIGYDMSSEAVRRAAMERARDTGRAATSGRVTLVQEIDPSAVQAGFLVYVPVYRTDEVPGTMDERREQLVGFAYSPFRADDLFRGSFHGESRPRLHFEVYDGRTISPESLLHDSHPEPGAPRGRLASTRVLEIAGRPWTVRFTSRPDFELSSGREAAGVVLVLGIFVSLALATVTWGQTRARAVADAHATRLSASRAEIQRLLERERDQATRLREADKRKDEFLAMLAHELRNPLAPISNALQAWSLVSDPRQLDHLRQVMSRQVDQLVHLIDDLLDISRISRGKITLRQQKTDLRSVLNAAVEGTLPMIESRDQSLAIHLPDPSPPLVGDRTRLVQVFSNLLNNASKYTPPGGRITIAAEVTTASAPGAPSAPSVVITVSDTGVGIPADMLERVFEMFTQVDGALDRAEGGLGIGLTLVRTLVEMHGGTVTASSDGPGMGSRFKVTLPMAPAPSLDSSGPGAAPSESAVDGTGQRHRVLVVDDVQASSRTLALMLRGIGQETREANDGPTALAAAEQFDPHVVFCDIAMPGMDGYEVIRRFRQRAAERDDGQRPLLVALTGYGQEEDRQRALAAGFDRHLVKPTSLEALRAILAELRT